jgi:MoxR-like ATPase
MASERARDVSERPRPLDPQAVLAAWLERDLSAAALAGELSAAHEVEALVEQASELIEAGRCPILVGESGVGKTAIVHELVRRAVAGQGPTALRNRRVLQFSFKQRVAGLRKPEQLRPETQRLADALVALGGAHALFFRDAHCAYNYDLEAQLHGLALRFQGPIVCEGERPTVQAMLENSPELAERYTLLEVEEPDLETTARLLARWAQDMRQAHGRGFAPRALHEALHLTHRFLARTRLPRKAVDLLTQVSALAGPRDVDEHDVFERFCREQRVPRALVDPRVPLDLAAVAQDFASRVLGQPEAVQAVVRMVALIKAGLSDVRRPFGVFLFVGPTGVGKTHIAQRLAEWLFGDRDRMLRLNMADFQQASDAELLFGNPGAYAYNQRRGLLTTRLLGRPFAVLLLDEFEKAHEKAHDRFLQLFDEGRFINGAGESVSCRSTIVIATSNTGAEVYRGRLLGLVETGDVEALDREVDRRLLKRFRFEFLNRFDQVVHFHPLTRADIRTIARRELALLAERPGLSRLGLQLELDDSVVDWLAVHGYDPLYGARVLRRTIERHVTTALAEALVPTAAGAGAVVELGVWQGRPQARLRAPVAERPVVPPSKRAPVTLRVAGSAQVRALDARGLRAEAEALLHTAAPRLERLNQAQEERAALLQRFNEASSWDAAAAPDGYAQLERFRELDLFVASGERLARPVRRLAEQLQIEAEAGGLARALEAARRALEEWDERLSDSATLAGGLWLSVASLDPLKPPGPWMKDLVALELAWCRRLGLAATVVAHERLAVRAAPGRTEAPAPALVVLEVEGPGAASLLAMEVGEHRLGRGRGPHQRCRVALVAKSAPVASGAPVVTPARPRSSPYGLEVRCQGRLHLEERGRSLTLWGADGPTLAHLLADVGQAWSEQPLAAPLLARVYGEDGAGARDPRTGAGLARLRDALRGELHPLLEAWRRHRAES